MNEYMCAGEVENDILWRRSAFGCDLLVFFIINLFMLM